MPPKPAKIFVFKIVEYGLTSKPYRTTTEKVTSTDTIVTLELIRKHFYVPRYLPQAFQDARYKNETLTRWHNENGEKNYKTNWANTYTYDSLARVTRYTYSGCFSCSNFAYGYQVSYNKQGLPVSIVNSINSRDRYTITYDAAGNVQQLDCFSFDRLEKRISRVRQEP